jgi:hypothetical protein
MSLNGGWVSYGGDARIELAVGLAVVAGGAAWTGIRLRRPLRAARPPVSVVILMFSLWVGSIIAFLVGITVYVKQYLHDFPHIGSAVHNPITPVTLIAVLVLACIILTRTGWYYPTRLGSAVVGAMAAPMIFEFPFDLIVMARVYPPVPPHPALYLALFFAPLLVVEVTTLSLLTLSPMIRLSRPVFLFFALMLAVFAVWALFGFAYPSAPAPIALNVVSKILALAAGLSLFLPQRAAASTTSPAASPPAMDQFTSAGQPRRAGKSAGAVATGSRPVSP